MFIETLDEQLLNSDHVSKIELVDPDEEDGMLCVIVHLSVVRATCVTVGVGDRVACTALLQAFKDALTSHIPIFSIPDTIRYLKIDLSVPG